MADAARPVDPMEERLALAGELIGAAIQVERAPGFARLPLRGTIVDETMHTFLVRVPGHARLRRVPKPGLEATLLLGERSIRLSGDLVRVRPEDRTKRLLVAGRSRRN